ncbi:hypothetical protein ACFRMN_31240 [Streptomyces sp. NPDC056835]|uniref:hypothetical protein n=1 Tax=Streptomyces sp. NPDC056835 TaxID=3345956 RepID=UPI00368A12B3
MTPTEIIEKIALDAGLSVPEKRERIIAFLTHSGDRGVPAALECLSETTDNRVSEFVAAYLQMIPGAQEEKTRAAERLRGAGPLAQSAARLVPWLPTSVIDAFIQDYLADPAPDSPLESVLLSIGVYFPERLRPHADRIENPFVRRTLLSGAPDSFADALLGRWRQNRDIDDLHSLALVRTQHAADHIDSLRDDVDDPEDWEWLMPLVGRLPDSGKNSGSSPSFMGFIADEGESDHVMGGTYAEDVPLCASCHTPAERILTLSSKSLPYKLSQDPTFFWFSCDCGEVDRIVARFTADGTRVYFGQQGVSAERSRIVPGKRSLVLEPHPIQPGTSLPAIPGRSQHQVGGLPRWPSPELHPICPGCGNFMPFLAAIDSGPTPFGPMGFEGLLFGFWCDDCFVSTTQIQE